MKYLKYIFSLLFIALLSACGSSKKTEQVNTAGAAETNTIVYAEAYATDTLFKQQLFRATQVLDANYNMYFIDAEGKKQDSILDFAFVCGTVPNYDMWIVDSLNQFFVYSNETFYDYGDKIPAEVVSTYSKKEADEVYLINGKQKWSYTGNFGLGAFNKINPNTIITKKRGLYYFSDDTKKSYDKVYFYNQDNRHIITVKNKMYGYKGIIEPCFKSVASFNYRLAKVELTDGSTRYLDVDGKIY